MSAVDRAPASHVGSRYDPASVRPPYLPREKGGNPIGKGRSVAMVVVSVRWTMEVEA